MKTPLLLLVAAWAAGLLGAATHALAESALDIGSRRELFVDHFLIDQMNGLSLKMHRPCDRGSVLTFDKPWEGIFAFYATIIHVDGKYQAYYRGSSGTSTKNSGEHQVVCYAESDDGITWTKPQLDLFPRDGQAKTNIVLAGVAPDTHNFSPFYDARPGVKPDERYKAIGGYHQDGLNAYVSPDGIHWRRLVDKPVLTRQEVGFVEGGGGLVFDTQNVPFWSALEGKYLLYYRVYVDHKRRTARVESDDFIKWTNPMLMEYRRAPGAPKRRSNSCIRIKPIPTSVRRTCTSRWRPGSCSAAGC